MRKMSARKEETPVACAAPFRRQGFGHVIPRKTVWDFYLTEAEKRSAPVKYMGTKRKMGGKAVASQRALCYTKTQYKRLREGPSGGAGAPLCVFWV